MVSEPTLFVGVDWASTEHQVCALGPTWTRMAFRKIGS